MDDEGESGQRGVRCGGFSDEGRFGRCGGCGGDVWLGVADGDGTEVCCFGREGKNA